MTTRISVPTFLGGISQQSPAIRENNLVESAKNVEFLATEGATKRYPTKFSRELNLAPGVDYSLMSLERDDASYVLAVAPGDIQAFDVTGATPTVVPVTGSLSYLSGAALDDLKTQRLADSILIANRTVEVAGAAGRTNADWANRDVAGLFVKRTNTGVKMTVRYQHAGLASPVTVEAIVPATRQGTVQVQTGTLTANEANGTDPLPLDPDLEFNSQSDLRLETGSPGSPTILVNREASRWTADVNDRSITLNTVNTAAGANYRVTRAAVEITYEQEAQYILGVLLDKLTAAVPGLTTERQADGSSALLRAPGNAAITLFEVSDTENNEFISGWTQNVREITDLPVVFEHGYTVRLTGDNVSTADDRYIRFATNVWAEETETDPDQFDTYSGFSEGYWIETVRPELPSGALDASTMPHELKRVEVSPGVFNFQFGPLDWEERTVGDEESNKAPSFVGQSIRDIQFTGGRLGIFSGISAVFSVTGEITNFWRTTTQSQPDSDRIDVDLADLDGDTINHAMPFNRQLLVFTRTGQALVFGDPTLTPSLIQAPVVSSYRANPNVTPAVLGQSIFFAYTTGQYSQIREFIPVGVEGQIADGIITLAAPKFVPRDIRRITPGSVDQMLVCSGSESQPNSLWVYSFLRAGDTLAQASWSEWTFDGPVEDVVFLEDRLAVLVRRGPNVSTIEFIELGAGRTELSSDFVVRLDRQVAATALAYDRANHRTAVVFPYAVPADAGFTVVAGPGASVPTGAVLPIETPTGSTTIFLSGDYSGEPVIAGFRYTAQLELSKPLVKQVRRDGSTAILGGSTLVRKLLVYLDDSGYLKARVEYLDADEATEEFLADSLGVKRFGNSALHSGELHVGIHSDVDDFKLFLESDSPLPFTLTSGAWDIRFNAKHRVS